jgi:hypothetical protein
MRIVYIYNPHNPREVGLIDQVKQELGQIVEEVQVIDFQEIRDQYKISQTPALVFIREDLQGDHLLDVDDTQSKLRLTLESIKHLQDEQSNLFQTVTNRLDYRMKAEVDSAITPLKEQNDVLGRDLVTLKLKAKRAGVTI